MTHEVRIELVNPADLLRDGSIQRREGVEERVVARMAANFRPSSLGTIVVSERADGWRYVVDGWHRVSAAVRVGLLLMWAEVHTGLDREEEAQMFLDLNAGKKVSAISQFLVRAEEAHDEEAVEILKVITEHGWRVGKKSDGHIAAVQSVEMVYRTGAGTKSAGHYPELLGQVLKVVTAAWGHDARAVDGDILKGLGQLYGRFDGAVDTHKLIIELERTSPDRLLGHASQLASFGGSVPAGVAKTLVGLLNKGRRSKRLPEWTWIR